MEQAQRNQALGYLLHAVPDLLDRIADDALRAGAGLTLSQFLLLLGIDTVTVRAPSQQEIARHLKIDRAAVSRQLNRLQARGLVARTPQTRRSHAVALTPQGVRVLRSAQRVMEETMTPHYAAAGDSGALITALTRIQDSLRGATPWSGPRA
jgi:DNA-binding MarR family transcriptional regulator